MTETDCIALDGSGLDGERLALYDEAMEYLKDNSRKLSVRQYDNLRNYITFDRPNSKRDVKIFKKTIDRAVKESKKIGF